MNEGENRNFESQNLLNDNQLNTYNNQQPNVNYDYSNNDNEPNNASISKKNSNIIIVILLLIILGLSGYIIYDKVIAEKDVNNNQNDLNNNQNDLNNNQNDVNDNQTNNNENNGDNEFNQDNNLDEKDIVFEKNINGKNIKVEYKFFVEYVSYNPEFPEPRIIVKLLVNGEEKDSWAKDLFPVGAEAEGCFTQEEMENKLNSFIKNIKTKFNSYVGTIKGDKDYIYVLSGNFYPSKILILNEKASVIDTINTIPDSAIILPGKGCTKYESYNNADNNDGYFIDTNAIYYLTPSSYDENWEHTYANEYKLTFANDKGIKEKINTCEVEIGGETGEIFFEDMVEEAN